MHSAQVPGAYKPKHEQQCCRKEWEKTNSQFTDSHLHIPVREELSQVVDYQSHIFNLEIKQNYLDFYFDFTKTNIHIEDGFLP